MDEEIDCAPEYMYENSYAYPSLKSAIQLNGLTVEKIKKRNLF